MSFVKFLTGENQKEKTKNLMVLNCCPRCGWVHNPFCTEETWRDNNPPTDNDWDKDY